MKSFFELSAAACNTPFREVHLGVIIEQVKEVLAPIKAFQIFQSDGFSLLICHNFYFHDFLYWFIKLKLEFASYEVVSTSTKTDNAKSSRAWRHRPGSTPCRFPAPPPEYLSAIDPAI